SRLTPLWGSGPGGRAPARCITGPSAAALLVGSWSAFLAVAGLAGVRAFGRPPVRPGGARPPGRGRGPPGPGPRRRAAGGGPGGIPTRPAGWGRAVRRHRAG